MKTLSILTFMGLLILELIIANGFADETPFESRPQNSVTAIEMGAFVGTNPPTPEAVQRFESLLGHDLNSIMWFQGWDATDQPAFPESVLNEILTKKTTKDAVIFHLT